MAIVYGNEAAVEAVREFLEDGYVVGGTPTGRLNDLLATRRTELGVTTAVLPDVALFESLWERDIQATRFPYLSVSHDGCTGEDDGPNSRMVDHSIVLSLVVLNANIAGNERAVGLAAARYADVIRALFFRRLPRGKQGWTLNNGGTGEATGRVIRASIDSQETIASASTPPNYLVLTRLTVRMQEVY